MTLTASVIDVIRQGGLGEAATWRADSACVDQPAWLFFSDVPSRLAAAVVICTSCPVREECLSYAVESGTTDGVWGGVVLSHSRVQRSRTPQVFADQYAAMRHEWSLSGVRRPNLVALG